MRCSGGAGKVIKINFDIVPLFESMQAMNNSEEIMKSLFRHS